MKYMKSLFIVFLSPLTTTALAASIYRHDGVATPTTNPNTSPLIPDDLADIILGEGPISDAEIDSLFQQDLARRSQEEAKPDPSAPQLTPYIRLTETHDPFSKEPIRVSDDPEPGTYVDPRDGWQFLRHDPIPHCETSADSPFVTDVQEFLDRVDGAEEAGEFCDQTNLWKFGSHCTTLWRHKSASFGVCGTASEGKVRCQIAILSLRKIVANCVKNGRVGGWEKYRFSPGDGERIEHKAILF
ncbi:hypothetical protein BJ508DRAFT_375704 [Ascobolus immersus RN42]|uniref:Ecp2 effector protein domain-containing protein n=1 Tax=Ascobolus immersus RN42 TaxID=1160509 RepID=A0A3N4IAG5_ASCIM|nr:hypothetical protein BJ508DRAFT_375704 [Ascobolus immersus RN42]